MMNEIGLKKASVEGSFWDFIAKLVEKIGALIFTIILARFLLPEGFGAYSLTMSVALVFIGFISYSLDGTMIRFVSDALGKKNKKMAAIYFKYLFKKKILFTFIASILLLILAYPLSIYVFQKPFLFPLLFISGFYIFVLAIENTYESLFYVFKRLKGRTIKEVFKQPLRIFITLLVFFLIAKSYYLMGIFIGLILTNIAVLIFLFFYVKRFAFFLFEKNQKEKLDKSRVLKFLYYLLIGGVAGAIFSYVDILILGILLPDTKYIGFYSAAVTLIWGLAGLLSFNSVFLPIFTQVKKKRLEYALNTVLKYSLMLTIPIAFGIVSLSKYILFVIYGGEYTEASVILSLMAFLLIESVNGSFITTLFSAEEKPKYATKIGVYTLFLNIILNFILISILLNISQSWALIGAATATIISRYVSLIFLISVMKKRLNVKLTKANWFKPLIASMIMFFVLFILNRYIVKEMTMLVGIFEIIVGILIYLFIMLLIDGISKKDLKIFKDAL